MGKLSGIPSSPDFPLDAKDYGRKKHQSVLSFGIKGGEILMVENLLIT